MFELATKMVKNQMNKVKAKIDRFVSGEERGIMDAVEIIKGLVMIVVIGAIGVYVADQVVTTTGTPAQANLSAMQTNVLAAGETGSNFIVILIIAFIGGIAISYLAFFGRGRK